MQRFQVSLNRREIFFDPDIYLPFYSNIYRQGLSDVINLDWLRMFSYRELQTLISGAEHEINVDDLARCTKYGNGFDEDHPTIQIFWKVVRSLTEPQKRCLLKFVTSCSRPPLLGFKVIKFEIGSINLFKIGILRYQSDLNTKQYITCIIQL